MPDRRYYYYEGLFLFPQAAAADLKTASEHVKSLLSRAEAEIIGFRKWDERRLAYEIKGNKRGVYFLVYFKAPADKLSSLERDCNLSEQLLRALVTRADHLTVEQMQAADAQEALADEIRLRAEHPEAIAAVDEPEPEFETDDEDIDLIEEEPVPSRRR